jgi:flagellar hook-associated protein 1 FlgK
MADLLSTGISGVRTYQRALATVGNNIANVDTEGYSRQRLEITGNASTSDGSLSIGNGARAVRVQRSYDNFVVSNLRSAQAQLSKHESALEYVTQLENILGDKQLSLSTSLNGFFAAVQEVSITPSSVAARQNLLNVAEATVSQFGSIGMQLESIEEDSYVDLGAKANEITQYAQQLSTLNSALNRTPTLAKQPNELLDRRDLLIQDMSKLLRVSVVEAANGVVDVHIGDVASGQYLVRGNESSTLGLQRSTNNSDEVNLVLDPYMSPQTVTQVVGGSIAGIMEFREGALTSLRDELDTLSQVFVGEVNDVHSLGINAHGEFGGELFSLGNIYNVNPGLNQGTGFVKVSALADESIERLSMSLTYSASSKEWTLTNLATQESVSGNTELTMGGIKVALTGLPEDGDTFTLEPNKRPIDALQMAVTDHSNIAAGGAVSVARSSTNTSATNMVLNGYSKPTAPGSDTSMDDLLRNNIATVAATSVGTSNNLAFVIPARTQDATFYSVAENDSSSVQMQVFTREGKQVYGSALSTTEQAQLMTAANGFNTTAAYDDTYRNQTGSNAYMDANTTVTNSTAGDVRDHFAIAGGVNEDLLVFVTGTGSAQMSGQWGEVAQQDTREQLRQNINVVFSSDASSYTLVDVATETNIASGTLSGGGSIQHNGWEVSFDGVVQANDTYAVRGNQYLAGDNRNLLQIIELQADKTIFDGRGDFTGVYTDIIGELGGAAMQAGVSRDAQQIIVDQAQQKRDETSAVSLDEEAANLLRFQQAYQASAQIISTANKLFDTILGIR